MRITQTILKTTKHILCFGGTNRTGLPGVVIPANLLHLAGTNGGDKEEKNDGALHFVVLFLLPPKGSVPLVGTVSGMLRTVKS